MKVKVVEEYPGFKIKYCCKRVEEVTEIYFHGDDFHEDGMYIWVNEEEYGEMTERPKYHIYYCPFCGKKIEIIEGVKL